jgi:hypothetical protein
MQTWKNNVYLYGVRWIRSSCKMGLMIPW